MLSTRFVLPLILFTSAVAMTKEPPHFQGRLDVVTTKDKLNLRIINASWLSHRRSHIYPYDNAEKKATDYGVIGAIARGSGMMEQFNAYLLKGYLGRKFSNRFYLSSDFGIHHLRSRSKDIKHRLFSYQFKGEYKTGSDFYLAATFLHDYVYHLMQLPKGITAFLYQDQLKLHFLLWKIKWMRSNVRIQHSTFNDNNTRFYVDLDHKFKLGPQLSWIWLGLGGSYYRYSRNLPRYWTPRKFISVGPRFEISGKLDKYIGYAIGLSLSRFKDESDIYGNGSYLDASIILGNRNKTNFKIGIEHILSQQSGGKWHSTALYLKSNLFP